eukprot:Colp12_sorted_trinity150504_noHs@2374
MGDNHNIWMGDLDPYWDETFITSVFESLGEPVYGIKMIRDRTTGQLSGFCFVDFGDKDKAERILNTYNGVVIPGSSPPKKFKLNWATYGKGTGPLSGGASVNAPAGPEWSIYVRNLSSDVTDWTLMEFFRYRYPTTKAAKVVCDPSGVSKGFGFVRFWSEEDQKRALEEMQGNTALGGKPLHINIATPKRLTDKPLSTTVATPYGNMTPEQLMALQYQQYYAMSAYYSMAQAAAAAAVAPAYTGETASQQSQAEIEPENPGKAVRDNDEPYKHVDVDARNQKYAYTIESLEFEQDQARYRFSSEPKRTLVIPTPLVK